MVKLKRHKVNEFIGMTFDFEKTTGSVHVIKKGISRICYKALQMNYLVRYSPLRRMTCLCQAPADY